MSKWSPKLNLVLATAALLLFLGGCAPFVDETQPSSDPAATITLKPGVAVGQTFVAQHSGLDGVEFGLRVVSGEPVRVQARLSADPSAQEELATSELTLPPGSAFSSARFAFPPQRDSHNAYRFISLSVDAGEVEVEAAPGGRFLNGSLHVNGESVEGQARFRLTYAPFPMLAETARAGLDALRLIAMVALLWALPGVAILSLCLPRARWRALSLLEKATLGAGLGVALYPVLMLWAATARIRFGPGAVWAIVLVSLLILAAREAMERRKRAIDAPPATDLRSRTTRAADALFVVALLAIFLTRLLVIRTLDAPSWGDSVQHAVMAQLMIDQGGLFETWLPYTPYTSLSIQYGFASNAAVVQHALGVDAAQATLIAGQLLNALAVLALYPLAVRIARGNRWAGVFAVIVAGLLSPMPAFYVNWGRYAQLAGQVVLPVALWLLWEAGESERFHFGVCAAAGLALAGMMLSYYRMPYNYAAFGLAWLLFAAIPHWGRDRGRWLRGVGMLATVAGIALVLVLPWLGRVANSSLADTVESGLTNASRFAPVLLQLEQWKTVTEYVPLPLIIAGLIAFVWTLARRKWAVVMIGPWALLMAALVAARLVKLPGANLLQTFAVMIMLYIPLGLLIGWLMGDIAAAAGKRSSVTEAATVVLALALVGYGALVQLRTVRPEFIYVTRPDARAMTWIRDNTPLDAVFLVEGFRIYAGQSAVGADAGWWIPLLGGRANTMPPQYALLNEKPVQPEYSRQVVDLVATLEGNAPGSDAGMAALRDMGVTHVYIGQTQGQTGMGVSQLFGPEDFLSDPRFTLVYHQDRVYIFAVAPQQARFGQRLPREYN